MELGCPCWVCRSHTTRACIRTLIVGHHARTECLRSAAVCSATQRDYHDRCNATLAPLLVVLVQRRGLEIFLSAGNASRAGGGVSAAGASPRADEGAADGEEGGTDIVARWKERARA